MGRCDARVLSTSIHGAVRLLPPPTDERQQQQQQQQQQEEEEKGIPALLSLLVEGLTARIQAVNEQQQQKEEEEGGGGAAAAAAAAAVASEKGGGKKRRPPQGGGDGGGVAVSPQDLAMALSSLGRAAGTGARTRVGWMLAV